MNYPDGVTDKDFDEDDSLYYATIEDVLGFETVEHNGAEFTTHASVDVYKQGDRIWTDGYTIRTFHICVGGETYQLKDSAISTTIYEKIKKEILRIALKDAENLKPSEWHTQEEE